MSDIVDMLRLRACSLDEQPEHDHGHTDCYLEREAADEIERLRSLITAWADALDKPCDATDLALAMYDADEAGAALRKAVGR